MQLAEKKEIKAEEKEEQRRLDEMMEIERVKSLENQEIREKLDKEEQIRGAKILQMQIAERKQQNQLEIEKKDQETKVGWIIRSME